MLAIAPSTTNTIAGGLLFKKVYKTKNNFVKVNRNKITEKERI
jgi:hypothetical protein